MVERLKPKRVALPKLPTRREQVYNTRRWRRLSAAIRRQRPVCEVCKNDLTTEVHHKVPIDAAPHRAFEVDNLLAVCTRCHHAEHARGGAYPSDRGRGGV
jgi:5-methylcytosine-specific restriction endonuclease McrA